MKTRVLALATILIAPLFWTDGLIAHPGRLDAKGCHTERKTGRYHCHRSQAQAPARAKAPYRPSPAHNPAAAPQTPEPIFRDCDEVRAAGKAPLMLGDREYGPHLDPDGDGIACEE